MSAHQRRQSAYSLLFTLLERLSFQNSDPAAAPQRGAAKQGVCGATLKEEML
jgi:hypothetical protein